MTISHYFLHAGFIDLVAIVDQLLFFYVQTGGVPFFIPDTQRMDKVPKPSQAYTPRITQESPKDHNLLQFFALLYKVDMRNKQEKTNPQKQKEKE